jgi:hypothetical protein
MASIDLRGLGWQIGRYISALPHARQPLAQGSTKKKARSLSGETWIERTAAQLASASPYCGPSVASVARQCTTLRGSRTNLTASC